MQYGIWRAVMLQKAVGRYWVFPGGVLLSERTTFGPGTRLELGEPALVRRLNGYQRVVIPVQTYTLLGEEDHPPRIVTPIVAAFVVADELGEDMLRTAAIRAGTKR